MTLTKQYNYSRFELISHFSDMLDKKLMRAGLQGNTNPADWQIEGYMDGPLTFVVLTHPSGKVFTGWSKFNPNDNNYYEHSGLFRAMVKATDKYIDALGDSQVKEEKEEEEMSTSSFLSSLEEATNEVRTQQAPNSNR